MSELLTQAPAPGTRHEPDPPGKPAAAGPARPAPPAGRRTLSAAVTAGGELALPAVTIAAVLGLTRLFAGNDFAIPVIAAALAAHALAWWCRRQKLGLAATGALALAGLGLAAAWLVEPHTTLFGIPRATTLRAMVDDLRIAWERFGEVKAPTRPLRGFVLASVAGTWLVATSADFFAFRMRARFEAMAPAFTLFVFGSILGADRLRLPLTALYLAAVLNFVLWSEAARLSWSGAWFGGRAGPGHASLLRNGGVLGAVALAVAVLLGPHLPGAGSAGIMSLRDEPGGGSRSRVTVSPLVDIRGRLVEQSDVELFTVRSNGMAYWRLTSLDRFDGSIWSSLGTYQTAGGSLPGSGPGRSLQQDYAIGPLGSIWLPAAYRADRLSGAKGARFDRDSASVLTARDTADGLRYSVQSSLPELTAAQLQGASSAVPDDVAGRYLALPSGFPAAITALARQVTADAITPYEKARRLQDWFRSGVFTYSLEAPAGHGVDAMEQFLFRSPRGYCEQFAASYAAMARALRIPARVAVGFVPGALGADGRYHVAGRDAHAWPEVYVAGYGWVAFEPTPGPGRIAPGTEAYTGIGASASSSESTRADSPAATTTTAPATAGTTAPPEAEEAAPSGASRQDASGLGPLARAGLLFALAIAAYIAAVMGGRRWLVGQRRSAATGFSEQVLVAWQETEEALAQAGRPRRPCETPAEFATRTAPALPESGPGLFRLATEADQAGFSVKGASGQAVATAWAAAEAVVRELRSQASPLRRVLRSVDPRPLLAGLPVALSSRGTRALTRPF